MKIHIQCILKQSGDGKNPV